LRSILQLAHVTLDSGYALATGGCRKTARIAQVVQAAVVVDSEDADCASPGVQGIEEFASAVLAGQRVAVHVDWLATADAFRLNRCLKTINRSFEHAWHASEWAS
jgi:hypothetical protein